MLSPETDFTRNSADQFVLDELHAAYQLGQSLDFASKALRMIYLTSYPEVPGTPMEVGEGLHIVPRLACRPGHDVNQDFRFGFTEPSQDTPTA
jgi:hypothetical protein